MVNTSQLSNSDKNSLLNRNWEYLVPKVENQNRFRKVYKNALECRLKNLYEYFDFW